MALRSCEGRIPKLGLGHRIFISHSSEDKDFVRILDKELRLCWYDPFFDEQSLPKAKEVSMENILTEAESCELALLVLTPEFFTRTKNPMMEVIAFVKGKVRLLPLFYKLTVEDVKKRKEDFREKWIELKGEGCQDDDKWTEAFGKLTSFNGLEYGKNSSNMLKFAEEVAKKVVTILPPEKRRYDADVVGKERLVQKVKDMFEMSPNYLSSPIKVVGLHGMEGMGKTTLCQALYNDYLRDFKGRVCHVELHNKESPLDWIQSIMSQLGPQSNAHSGISATEAQYHLEGTLNSSEFFMMIDDIQESDKDEVGRLLLNRLKGVPMKSKLLLLARRKHVLQNMLERLPECIDKVIRPLPGLNLDEAKYILCKESRSVFPDNHMNHPEQIDFLNQCAELCTLTSGSGIYNPVMLKSLASFLVDNWMNREKDQQCHIKGLTTLKRCLTYLKGDRSRVMKEFFDKLKASFNSMIKDKECEETFLDLALFVPREDVASKQLCLRDKRRVKESLQNLRDASFLLDGYDMHDVHRELAKRIARESSAVHYAEHEQLKGADLLHILKNNYTRMAFVNCTFPKTQADLDLSECDQIKIVLLDGNKVLSSVILCLNSLQSVEIRSVTPLCIKAGPTHHWQSPLLAGFRCLVIFELGGIGAQVWSFDAEELRHCHSLEVIQLYNINLLSGTLELSRWQELRELKLVQLPNLEILSGLEHLSTLRKLHLSQLNSLSDVQLPSKLITFTLDKCKKVSELRLPGSLQHCSIKECDTLGKIHVVSDNSDEELSAGSSDEERVPRENRFMIKDCGNLQEIVPMHASLDKYWRMSYIEFRKREGTWHLHGWVCTGANGEAVTAGCMGA